MARRTESPAAPRVSAPDLPPVLDPRPLPRRGDDLLAARVTVTGDADLAHSSWEQCVLALDAHTVDLAGATLLDVALSDVRVASLTLRNAGLRRVQITGGRIGTLDLSATRIGELELRDLRIDYLTLGGAQATDVLVHGCTIRALDVPQAVLSRVCFEDCRSEELDPRGLRASDVDLRGLDLMTVLDTNSLRGTTLSPRQVELLAPAFATSAGIQVKD